MASVFDGVPALSHMDVGPGIDAYVQGRSQVRQDKAMDMQRAQEVSAIVTRGAQSADTPEKWGQFVGILQKRFPDADLSTFTDFATRQSMLDQARDPYKDAALDLERSNAARSQSNADRTYALEQAKLAATGGPKTSLVPIWGQDAQGNNVLGQPNDRGELVPTKLPPDFKPSKGVDKIDAGTEWILIDQQSGAIIGRQPKNVAGAAAATAVGTGAGNAAVNLPKTEQQATTMLATLEALKNHKVLPDMVGGFGPPGIPLVPKDILPAQPGTPGADFVSLFDQVKGQAFLQAFESLKGGGQITEVEGQKATEAINRLRRNMSPEDFKKAIDEIEAIVQRGLQRAQQSAKPAASGSVAPPQSGIVDFQSYFGSQ